MSLLRAKGETKCRACPAPASGLHHLIPKSQRGRLRRELANQIPSCQACHSGWHAGSVTMTRDLLTGEEWALISEHATETWLLIHYPPRPVSCEVDG